MHDEAEPSLTHRSLSHGQLVGVIVGCGLIVLGVLAGLVALAFALSKERASTSPEHENVTRINLAELRKELDRNEPATLNKYVGQVVEVEVDSMSILGGDAGSIRMGIGCKTDKTGATHITYEARFYFDDQRNFALKNVGKNGYYSGRIRGPISTIAPIVRNSNDYIIYLRSAWVEGDLILVRSIP
jgi:hypothetical protein